MKAAESETGPRAGGDVERFVGEFSPRVGDIALTARERILGLVPDARERVIPGWKAVTYTLGDAERHEVVSLVLHGGHVNLQFPAGVHLPDPGGLLEGSGKSMRHVKLTDAGAVGMEQVGKLILAAAERARSSTTTRDRD